MDNWDDVIDSRDVLERIEEIQEEMGGGEPPAEIAEEANRNAVDLAEEFQILTDLVAQLRQVGGDTPEDGQTLIRDSYFQTYAQELADDLGAIPDTYTWPISCIDWEQAARELQMDYTPVEFNGVTYWVR